MIKAVSGIGLINALGYSILLLQSVIFARILGPELFGVFSALLAAIFVFTSPTRVGIATLITKHLSVAEKQCNLTYRKSIIKFSTSVVGLYVIACCPILYMTLLELFPEISRFSLAIICTVGVVASFEAIRASILRCMGNIYLSVILEKIFKTSTILALVLGAYFANIEITVDLLVFVLLVSYSLPAIYGVWAISQKLEANFFHTGASIRWKIWLKSISLISLFQGVKNSEGSLYLVWAGATLAFEDVAFLKIALATTALLSFPQNAINTWLGPKLSTNVESGDFPAALRWTNIASGISFAATAIMSMVILLFGSQLVMMLYGAEYMSVINGLLLLALVQMVNSAFGARELLINMAGEERYTIIPSVISIFTGAIVAHMFIESDGFEGMILGFSVSSILWRVSLLIISITLGMKSRP